VSFGGYVGVPLVIAAKSLRLPILIHEQTLRPGLANTFAGRLSGHIAVGFKAAASFFPAHKTTYTGNPLRQELFYLSQTNRGCPQ
jgi:UDP-N-acetylglucosamine--N-acetylmuramyl-(pentapeptide) pyrophosphoryl-undecaprenol N-acetylglucosamine transferase